MGKSSAGTRANRSPTIAKETGRTSDLESREDGLNRLLGLRFSQSLSGYEFGGCNLVEGRIDNVKVVNLRRSVDESCQRLQHVRISLRVVSLGIGLVLPQTDCGHIDTALTC